MHNVGPGTYGIRHPHMWHIVGIFMSSCVVWCGDADRASPGGQFLPPIEGVSQHILSGDNEECLGGWFDGEGGVQRRAAERKYASTGGERGEDATGGETTQRRRGGGGRGTRKKREVASL